MRPEPDAPLCELLMEAPMQSSSQVPSTVTLRLRGGA